MRMNGTMPLSKVPHFSDAELDSVAMDNANIEEKQNHSHNLNTHANSNNNDSSSNDSNRSNSNSDSDHNIEVDTEMRTGETEEEFLIRSCRYGC